MIYQLILIPVLSHFAQCSLVPVLIWSRQNAPESTPALKIMAQDYFKDTLLSYLKQDFSVVIFTEKTLSLEDFTRRDKNGEIVYPLLQKLKTEANATYLPQVEDPIGAIKELQNGIPMSKDKIVMIDLSGKIGESRFDMLKRHDDYISARFEEISKGGSNVLGVYTGMAKASNPLPGAAKKKLKGFVYKTEHVLLYLTSPGKYSLVGGTDLSNQTTDIDKNFTLSSEATDESRIEAKLSNNDMLDINFTISKKNNYWRVDSIKVMGHTKQVTLERIEHFYAPVGFSFYCGDVNLTDEARNVSLVLPGFQIQAFGKSARFGRAYHCTGFVTIGICSGIFVTGFLLIILMVGISMIMNIGVMDRFDDPKGKMIYISEVF